MARALIAGDDILARMRPAGAGCDIDIALPSLEALHDWAGQYLAAKFAEKGQIEPTWFFYREKPGGAGGMIASVETLWQSADEKAIIRQLFARMMADMGVIRYAFICESWMVALPPGRTSLGGIEPRNHPEKIECVIAISADAQRSIADVKLIKRGGWKIALEPHDMGGANIAGEFAGLLRRKG